MVTSDVPFFLAQDIPSALANPSTWQDTLTQVGPIGVVALALIVVVWMLIKARDADHRSALQVRDDHLRRVEEYHLQEKDRSNKLIGVVESNTAAMTELKGCIQEMRRDIGDRDDK